MAPVPQESVEQEADVNNRVVISGMSGLYPNAHNIEELSDILYNKGNPITKEHNRWTYNHPEADPHIGAVPDLTLFDAQFFRVHKRLGDAMDPMSRKILEESYKAIYDAGLSREHLSGKKVGVYIGVCISESEKACYYVPSTRTGFGIAGCSRTMFANRISYWLNAKGPSHGIDQGCCSSSAAMLEAYQAMKRGVCEAAIVGGCCLCLHPQSSVHYSRLAKLSMNGTTKSYDQNADGLARSEAITVFLLQKAPDALRTYGEIVYMKCEYMGLKEGPISPKFGYDRDPVTMANFINKVYDEAGIPPSVVEYVEGFGSADPDADKSELEALAAVFKPDKNNPLLLGSVMSSIGYTEAASGITAVTKVLLGYHKGELAGNLHFETPRQDVEATRDGRIKVLADHHKFGRSFTAVNGISVTGANAHILLHGNYKPKDPNRYISSIPRLVTLSARMDTAVEKMLKKLKSSPVDPEQLALFHNIHSKAISGHLGRGYIILDTDGNETVSVSEKVAYYDDVTRPLVFVYSGMGSQWAGMGAQLMKIPIFSAAIERCDRVLKPKGIDIVNIITSPDKNILNNILHCFLGIAAVQIGLTDILQAIGLVPDFIIGHSVGEQGCAYGDGCFTTEEMMLSAYYRGMVSVETKFIRGTMAAVGIGYQKMKDMCPPEIEVACHNSVDSCTISGPEDEMKQFMEKLVANNIFTKEVPCSNIAYHSRYIAEAGPVLLKYLSEVIKSPKERSKRWLSTSVPEDKWDEPAAKLCSAEYHTNNQLNPVLFEEAARLLPKNAIMVEIAPHGLLQAILKRSMPDTCSYVSLTRRNHPDTVVFLLEAIGQLYLDGYVPQLSALYPKVEFPVSTGTPFLSNYVHWSHNESWGVFLYMSPNRNKTASCKFVVSTHDDDYSYLQGHVIRGKTVYPYAAALVAVWDTLAMSKGQKKKQISVEFSDVQLYVQPIIHDRRYLRIYVNLHKGSGKFEVLDGESTVASGYIKENKAPIEEHNLEQMPECNEKIIKSNDVYQLLEKRNYNYSGKFRGIYDITESYNKAHIEWNNNWTTFISSLLQMYTLNHEYEGVSEPHRIRSLNIDVEKHFADNTILSLSGSSVVKAYFEKQHEFLCCGGVKIKQVLLRDLPSITKKDALKCLKFVPHFQTSVRNRVLGGDNYLPYIEKLATNSVVSLQSITSGCMDSLRWVDQPPLKGSGIPVTVQYCSFNQRDAMQAMGLSKYNGDNVVSYAMEFSGVTDNFERVMGLIPSGAASSRVLAIPDLLWPVPEHWTLEDAATVPLAYAQVIYCMFIIGARGTVRNVFVHCGAGGLGQAVISMALAHNYTVFTTVSDQNKKRFLLKLFPKLDEKNIGNCRDHTFADMVLMRTQGKGCNLVFSSIEGALKNTTLRITANNGITYDFSHSEDYVFEMFNLTRDRSFIPIGASSLFANKDDIKKIQNYLADGISQGIVVPLTRITFPSNEVDRALRLLAAGKNRGRVMIKMGDFMKNPVLPNICNSHLGAIEQSLKSAETVLTAETYEDTGLSLMEQISCIAIIDIPTDDNTTLETLVLDDVKLKAVSKLMRDTYSLYYNEEKLKSFSMKRLKNLESMITESEFQEVKGLRNFFSIVDSDELLATTEMVFMPTMCSSSSIKGEEFDLTQTHLCIVPGLEGHNKRFTRLCERVKSTAIVLQPGLDNLEHTIPEMAQNYAQVLMKKTGLKSDFYLMGYESGVLVVLEMAAILEANGCVGTIFCVGTPEDLKTTLEEELKVYKTEEDLQDAVAEHMFVLMGGDTKQLVDLKNIHTWDEKVNIYVRTLVGRVSHSAQYARTLIKAAYARLSQARRYEPRAHTLRSQIVQIRAHKQKGSLQIYSEQPVIVYELKAPMSNAAADLRCSNIINKHLDKKLIEEFDDKNTCDSYLSNCDVYTFWK